jgi:dolichol-phosphate mannosyltransferase
MMETVAIVIPTLNEARAIGKVIDEIPVDELLNAGLKTTAYVVDGCSTDKTIDIARQKGARIIIEEDRGKGAAVRTAFRRIDTDYVIMVDGDDTYPIDVVPRMVLLLQTHDVVVGSRLKGRIEPGAMTRVNVAGNTLLTLLARLLFNVKVSDVCTGLWGFRRDAIRRLELAARGFELEADLFADSVLKGCSIVEIPITYRARHDRPKLASLRDGLKIGAFLFKKYLHQTRGRTAASRAKNADGVHK